LSFSLLHFDQVNQNNPVVQCLHTLLTKVQYSSLDLSESQQENAEDSDVRDERERINTTDVNTLINSDSIVIKNLMSISGNG
jgi:hypothetical protein